MSGDILDYIPRGVRGEKCKIFTHKSHIEKMVLDHLDLNLNTYFYILNIFLYNLETLIYINI